MSQSSGYRVAGGFAVWWAQRVGPRAIADRGSASVLVAVWAAVATALAGAGIVLSTVLAARERVAAAADLAALAGASLTLTDPQAACARAQQIARANAATVARCRVVATAIWVDVRAPAPASVNWMFAGRAGALRARAHAELTASLP